MTAPRKPTRAAGKGGKAVKPVKAWAWKWLGKTVANTRPAFIFEDRYRVLIVPDDGSYKITPTPQRARKKT